MSSVLMVHKIKIRLILFNGEGVAMRTTFNWSLAAAMMLLGCALPAHSKENVTIVHGQRSACQRDFTKCDFRNDQPGSSGGPLGAGGGGGPRSPDKNVCQSAAADRAALVSTLDQLRKRLELLTAAGSKYTSELTHWNSQVQRLFDINNAAHSALADHKKNYFADASDGLEGCPSSNKTVKCRSYDEKVRQLKLQGQMLAQHVRTSDLALSEATAKHRQAAASMEKVNGQSSATASAVKKQEIAIAAVDRKIASFACAP